jgi:hypothetical protein
MDKKEYNQRFKEVFAVMCMHTILNPITALNISYSYTGGNTDKIKKNAFFPKVEKKQGMGNLPKLPGCRKTATFPSIFANYYYFASDLKKVLHPKVYEQLHNNRKNPQVQLDILKKVGL